MKPICEKCYSRNVYPTHAASLDFPNSLNQTLLSPNVLASIGASICKSYHVNPVIGAMAGTLLGGVVSLVGDTSKTQFGAASQDVYYCQDCHHIFSKDKTTTDGTA